ncbi:MAG: phage baseplate assembly protein V [Oscillospiraceae bacterium]|jgi:uncharacterized protein involved in type VI secretion and phage assembly|nr:phage baseplate assembly protein V [Oscillospiraceae bacterium]
MSIMDALSGDRDGGIAGTPRYDSLVLATVTNLSDPEKLGRVKCRPVTADAEVRETEWCYHLTPWGSDGSGFFFFPNVGDLVVIAYLFGEITRPVILGGVWTGSQKAPYAAVDGKSETAAIKTKKGLEIKLDLKDGKEKLTLITPKGAAVKLDDEAEVISISDKDGKNALTLDIKGGTITLKAKTKLILSAGDSKITLNSAGSAEIESKQSLKAEAATIELKGKSSANINAAQIELKAQGQLTLQSGGITNVKGSVVKIN